MAIGSIIKGALGAKAAGRRGGAGLGPAKGGTRGGRAATGGTAKDAAIGRGVRGLLRKAR
ncbi:hypothetical protein [Nocardioides ferulae]|uniref:hypothetical protein n=1 Tax=Nocardioides ferulae TaxID=2340821 RepID=UPI000EB1C6F7|nr:hypothetical protein [Nocardioides ferulae]